MFLSNKGTYKLNLTRTVKKTFKLIEIKNSVNNNFLLTTLQGLLPHLIQEYQTHIF